MQNKAIWKLLTISIILMMVASTTVVGADRANNTSNIYSGNVSDSRSAVKPISSAGNANAQGYEITWNDEEPELYVHPTYLEFGEMRIGETACESFYVENTGGGVLDWDADCDSWIDVSPSSGSLSGGDGEEVEVEIDTSYLEGGESYEGDICVTSNGGAAGVCVVVYAEEEPELYVHPTYLEFGEIGTGETAWASFYVENTGGGVLEWGAGCDMDWIEVYHDYGFLNGGDNYVVEVKIDTTDLEGGESYEGDICVTSNGGAAGVCVVVYVEEEPELYVHPTYLDFGEMRTGETAWASFYVENTGGGLLEWGAGWDMNWIEVYPDYGLLNGGDDYEVEVEIDTTNLEEGESGSIYLTSNGGDAEVCVEVKIEGSTPIYHLPIYPPIASFTYVPQSPITIVFDASCSYDSDGTIVEYNWDFGDGVMGSGITYNHSYIVNGTYTVKLTVIDNDHSTDTITYNVTITNVTSYDICDFINDLGLENITFAHLIALVKLFRHESLDSIPPEHRPNGVIKNLTEDDINAVVAYFHGDVVLGNNYAKKSCGRECIAVSEKPVHNLNTGENFSTIQAAIDDKDTKEGHTITVYSGVYYENVVVNKSVKLMGIGQPVVDAGGKEDAIALWADGITLVGFIATNSESSWGCAGIKVISSNNTITGNNVRNNWNGICLDNSSNNTITWNNASSNDGGIFLRDSSNNTITGNTFLNDGLRVSNSYQNTVKDNTVNGKPLVYLEDVSDCKVEDAGQVILVNCNNITVKNLDLSDTSEGIELWETEDSKVVNNTVCNNNGDGISLYESSNNNNTITGNDVCNNRNGIYLDNSSNSTITWNNASSNTWDGIFLWDSSNNSITGNDVCSNDDGIHLFHSCNNNIITGNNVCNNNYGSIYLFFSSNNTITGNNVRNNDDGIHLSHCSNNTITGNNASSNTWDGIFLRESSNNSITGNTFLNDGFRVSDSYQNTVEDNTVNGKPLVYLEDAADYKVEDAGQVILVNCDNITVENLDLSDTSVGIELWGTVDSKVLNNIVSSNNGNYGISLRYSSNNTITGNNVSNNEEGISLYYSSSNNIITGNNASNNGDYGICLYSSNNNIITGNDVSNNGDYGICLYSSNNNIITGNDVSNNSWGGIHLYSSNNNIITGNNVCNNGDYGISLRYSSNNTITGNTFINDGLFIDSSYQNIVEDNIVNAKPLVYLEDVSNYKVKDAGQIILVNCNNITVENLDLSSTNVGIELLGTENSKIINNRVSNNNIGIGLYSSSNNTIIGNTANSNHWNGIKLWDSSNNLIYFNNFIDNGYSYESTNTWNSTEKITYIYNGTTYKSYLGNYWDDYEGTDADRDGIGNTPYSIDSVSDDYPLMKPFENYIISTSAPA